MTGTELDLTGFANLVGFTTKTAILKTKKGSIRANGASFSKTFSYDLFMNL